MTSVNAPVRRSMKDRLRAAAKGLPQWVRGSRPLRGWLAISLLVARTVILTVGIALAIWIAIGVVGVLVWAIGAVVRVVMELLAVALIVAVVVGFLWVASKANDGSKQPAKPQAPPPPPSLRQSLAPADSSTSYLPFAALPTAAKKARIDAAKAAEAGNKKR